MAEEYDGREELPMAAGESVRPRVFGLRLVESETEPEVIQSSVTAVAESGYDRLTKARFRRWLGGLSVGAEVGLDAETPAKSGETDVLKQLRDARGGSPEARKSVAANIMTAVVEACYKSDHISRIRAEVSHNGEVVQLGQSMKSVHANALTKRSGRHPSLRAITEAEALNGHRIEDAIRAGRLRDEYFAVWSLVPNNVPEKQLGPEGDGYFLDSMTYVVQLSTLNEQGDLVTESVFMAGVEHEEGMTFQDRQEARHDFAAVARIYGSFGLEAPRTADELLGNGLFISKDLLPNGASDIMRWCDESTNAVLERPATRPPEYYQEIEAESRRREASLASVQQEVLADLLWETDRLPDAMAVVRRIWELVRVHTVEAAATNLRINPTVFGAEAAQSIYMARMTDDPNLRRQYMSHAQETAVISGCGGGSKGEKSADGSDSSYSGEGSNSAGGGRSGGGGASEGGGACDYTHTGCYCSSYYSNGKKRPTKLRVVAQRDSKGFARCKRAGCNAWLSPDGKRKGVGTIMKRALAMQSQAA